MKFCNKCEYSEQKMVQDQRGNVMMGLLCNHSECRDVLDGSPIPCLPARQNEVFCGFKAKYYKEKVEVEDAKIISIVKGKKHE